MNFRKLGHAAVVSVLGTLALTTAPVLAEGSISVMSFGGAYQEAQRKAVFETYTAKTGTAVSEQEYGGEIAKIAAMIESGNTTVDVVDVDAPTLLQGCDEGIFETIDWSKIGPKEDWLEGTTSDCGVGTIVYSTALAYNGATLKDGPKVIADLFDTTKFPGKAIVRQDVNGCPASTPSGPAIYPAPRQRGSRQSCAVLPRSTARSRLHPKSC